jgi:hypothetical protein
MCIVCVELVKQKMSISEAERNLGEMVTNPKDPNKDHYAELEHALKELEATRLEKLFKKAMEEYDAE